MKAKRTVPSAQNTVEDDLAQDRMGRNKLQGDDQERVRNERQDQPDSRIDPDETMESFTKMDKEERARSDLNKGARKTGGDSR